MRRVIILGHGVKPHERAIYDGCFNDDLVWTMNDWKRVYPRLRRPSRLYQMHDNWGTDGGVRPFKNWVQVYNSTGAEVRTIIPVPGLLNARVFNYESAMADVGDNFFHCTVSYMLYDAMVEGLLDVEMVGVTLDSRYSFQLELVDNIRLMEGRGMRVAWPHRTMEHRPPEWGVKQHYGHRAGLTKFTETAVEVPDACIDFKL